MAPSVWALASKIALGTKANRRYSQALLDRLQALSGVAIPKAQAAIAVAAGQVVALGAKPDRHRVGLGHIDGVQKLASVGVPQPDGLVETGADQAIALGAKVERLRLLGFHRATTSSKR